VVSFRTGDGITLRGHVFGSGDRWVILSHMFPDDQTAWYPFAAELAGRGYHVLTYDFRGYGESEGTKQIERIDRDLTSPSSASMPEERLR
jgi:pimeloyl-ACP methyl ester carboxylesterase